MKTHVYIGTSLDGFIARKDGDIDWLVQFANDDAIHAYEEFIAGIDAIVIGRGTFEKVLTFPSWPYEKKVFVLSNTLKKLPAIVENKAILLSLSPADTLKKLSQEGYTNVYVDGGLVIQNFLKADLIDELIISKVPIIIGSGIPLFADVKQDLLFQHMKTEVQSNELVRSYYKRKRR